MRSTVYWPESHRYFFLLPPDALLGGPMVIKGKWSDGKALLAIPYYARNNRTAQAAKGPNRGSSVWLKDQ